MLATNIKLEAVKAALVGRCAVVPSINDGNAPNYPVFGCANKADCEAWEEDMGRMKAAEAVWIDNGCSTRYDPDFIDF